MSLHTSAQRSLLNGHLGKNETASVTFGMGDLGAKGYNLIGHLEMFKRHAYTARDVIKSVEPWYNKYINPNFGVRSTFSYPGNFIGAYPDDYADENLAGTNISKPRPGCLPQNIQGGLCRFDQWARVEASPSSDRVNAFLSGRKTLSENLTMFSEMTFSNTKTVYGSTPNLMQPGSTSTWYDSINKKVLKFTEAPLPVGHPDNPYSFPIPLRYRFADDVSIFKSDNESDQYRVLVGLEGNHFGWDWNAALGNMASKVKSRSRYQKNFVEYVKAIQSGEYRFGGTNSPALLLRMFPELGSDGKSAETFFDLRGSRDLMDMAGGKMAMAAGMELRHETFEMRSTENIRKAEIVGYGATDISGSRNMSAAFVELVAPFSKKLEASFALRADKSSHAPSSVVPKLGLRFAATDFLTLRGTYAHGFRAPNLAESGSGSVSAFQNSLTDPKRCATANKMYDELRKGNEVDQADALTARDSGCSASASVLITPNPNLEPEKSKSYTLGFILEPAKDFSILLDYFHIDRRNEIGTSDVDQILANEDRAPGSVERQAISDQDRAFAARVKALSGKDINFTVGKLQSMLLPYLNQNKSRRSGIDLEIASKWNLGAVGKLSAGLEATYMLDYRNWDANVNDYTENLVGNYDHNRLRAVLKFSLDSGNWQWGTRIKYTSGTNLYSDKYDINYNAQGCDDQGIIANDCKIKADTTVDVSVVYKGIKNTSIVANFGNIFNRPFILNARTNNSAPARGRIIKLGVEYKF